MLRLKHDVPQRPRIRRVHLKAQGLTDTEVRIFEYVLQKTVPASEHAPAAPLSLSKLAAEVRTEPTNR
jgi:hypothetical protein